MKCGGTCIEDARLTVFLFQEMLENIFHTKQNMAQELGISYGKLTQVWTSDHITKGTQEAMEHLLTYCVKNKVPLDEIIKNYR